MAKLVIDDHYYNTIKIYYIKGNMLWINTATLVQDIFTSNENGSVSFIATSPWPSGLTPFPVQPAAPRASVKADWKVGTGAQSSSSLFSTEVTFLTTAETKDRTKRC